MPVLSGFFDPRSARRAISGVPARLQFHGADGSYTYVVGERDPSSGRYIAKHKPVPFGAKLALDFGGAERGWLSFRPYNDSHLVPVHRPVDPEPPDSDYVRVVRLPVWLEGFGLAMWTLGGVISQNSIFALLVQFEAAGEAAAGKIPVCALRPSQQIQIASRAGEVHTAPVLEIVGWMPRDDGRFGPRTVPMPTPKLAGGGGAGAPLIPSLEAAANDYKPPAPPVLPANDAFAGMTPITTTSTRPQF